MKIITLTLNPAFDIHCHADGFLPYRESIVEITSRDAGGKGVNISRALCAFSRSNTAVIVVGDENGEEFCNLLAKESISVTFITCHGRIRENITLHESQKPETRISFGGFALEASAFEEIQGKIGECDENTLITFTGSIPKGIEKTEVMRMLADFRMRGAKVVIDSRSVTLSEILECRPWLIKPNLHEMEGYIGREIKTVEDAATVAKELCACGVENVMISLGENGAVLATEKGTFYAKAPSVSVKSTIGAGDSSIAGFLDAYAEGLSQEEMLKRAVAFGTASCMREGTKPPLPKDVLKILEKIAVVTILPASLAKD